MFILPKAVYIHVQCDSYQNPHGMFCFCFFSTEIEKTIWKFVWKHKRLQKPKQSWEKSVKLNDINNVSLIQVLSHSLISTYIITKL